MICKDSSFSYKYNILKNNYYCYKCYRSISLLSISLLLPTLNNELFNILMELLEKNIIIGLDNSVYNICNHVEY